MRRAHLFALQRQPAAHGADGDAGRVLDVEADEGGSGLVDLIPRLALERRVVQPLARRDRDRRGRREELRVRHPLRLVPRVVDHVAVLVEPVELKRIRGRGGKGWKS